MRPASKSEAPHTNYANPNDGYGCQKLQLSALQVAQGGYSKKAKKAWQNTWRNSVAIAILCILSWNAFLREESKILQNSAKSFVLY